MTSLSRASRIVALFLTACGAMRGFASAQAIGPAILPEQRCIAGGYAGRCPHDPAMVPSATPRVVRADRESPPRRRRLLSLREAIYIAVQNAEVIRVAAGDGVSSTGQTIYDPAIANTTVDRARSRFDPQLAVENDFSREEQPGVRSSASPPYAEFGGYRTDAYQFSAGVTKQTMPGGAAGVRVLANPTRSPDPAWDLSPRSSSSVEFSYSQPLLKDAGRLLNLAPITIRVYETEQSYYQLKGTVQQLVRSTAELYWSLVAARIDIWTRRQQIRAADWGAVLAEAKLRRGLGDASDLAQARVTLANLRAQMIAAEATRLNREQALRNLLGWPPSGREELVPTTPPSTAPLDWAWDEIVATAVDNRPDLAMQRLDLRIAGEQLRLARNDTLPDLSANASYRFNELAGRTAGGTWIDTGGQYASWRLGLDLNVPLGQRDARAALREKELSYARDRANYEESLHQTSHSLARTFRDLEQSLLEYHAFQETRAAAKTNVQVQQSRWKADFTIYINVLQAIASWGDAVSNESRAVLQYNSEMAQLQEQMGVILQANGVVLDNQYFYSLGPGGRMAQQRVYPHSILPQTAPAETSSEGTAAEHWFELDGLDIPSLELPPRGSGARAPQPR